MHLLEVLLHTLPVLRHHGWSHAAIAALLLILLLIIKVSAVVAITVAELVTAKLLVAAVIVAHVTSWLSSLDLDGLAENLKGLSQGCVYCSITVKGNESKPTRSSSFFIHHKGSIDDTTELLEELCEVFFGRLLADTADEDLAGTFLLFPRNGTFRIDLFCQHWVVKYGLATYNLAIEIMLLHHDNVDTLGVFESQKAKSS